MKRCRLGPKPAPRTGRNAPSVRRTFKFRERLSLEPVVEMFNLANANTVTSRSRLLGPVYHRVNGILPGRLVRFGFDARF